MAAHGRRAPRLALTVSGPQIVRAEKPGKVVNVNVVVGATLFVVEPPPAT